MKSKTRVTYHYYFKKGKYVRYTSSEFYSLNLCVSFARMALREAKFPDEAGVFPPSEGWFVVIEKTVETVERVATVRSTNGFDKLKKREGWDES